MDRATALVLVFLAGSSAVSQAQQPDDTIPLAARISGKELREVPALTLLGALAGRVAGVRLIQASGSPGTAPSIRLRGATSIADRQDPLIVVDGTILRGDLADLSSEDIERVEIAKGPATSALYGSEGAAGVILVYTRRGSEQTGGKFTLETRNEIGPSFVSRRIAESGAHSFQLSGGDFLRNAQGNRIREPDRIADNPYPKSFDHQGELLETGLLYTNHLTLGGRRKGTGLQASFQNTHSDGVVFGLEGFRRQNLRLNADQQLGRRLDASVSTFYGHSSDDQANENPGGPFFALRFLEPHVNLLASNPDGTPYLTQIQDNGVNAANPLYNLANERRVTTRNRVIVGADLRWRPLDWLTAVARFHADRAHSDFSDSQPFGYLTTLGGASDGFLQATTTRDHSSNAELGLTATARWAGIHAINRLAVLRDRRSFAQTQQFFASLLDRPGPPAPDSATGSNSRFTARLKSWSLLAATSLSLENRYYLDLLARRDRVGLVADPGQTNWYYQAAFRWTLRRAAFHAAYGSAGLRPSPLELYFGPFGTVGVIFENADLRPARSRELELGVTATTEEGRLGGGYTFAQKWTRDQIMLVNVQTSGGVVQQFRNGGSLSAATHELTLRVGLLARPGLEWTAGLTLTRSHEKITDFPLPERLAGFGQQPPVIYLAEQGSLGVMLGNRFVRRIEELYDDPAKAALRGAGQTFDPANFVVNEEGYVVAKAAWRCGEDHLYHDSGQACSTPERPITYVRCRVANPDGSCALTTSIVRIGDTNPDFTAGIHSAIRYRRFRLTALLDWNQGGDLYNGSRQWSFLGLHDRAIDQRNKPVAERKSELYYAQFYNGLNGQAYFVESGTYLKLREAALSYTLHSKRLGDIRLGLVGRNLFTLTGYSGYDPEAASRDGDPFLFRMDWFGYPQFRSISATVEIAF